MSDPAIDIPRLLRLAHPAKTRGVRILPHPEALDDAVVAGLLGIDVAQVRTATARLLAERDEAVEQLLGDDAFRRRLDDLPWGPADVVVTVGDSLTDDLHSWAELLRACLERTRPEPPRVVNAGVSGDTTLHVLERFGDLMTPSPTAVLVLLLTNDTRRDGPGEGTPMLSVEESARNLGVLRARLAAEAPGASRWWLSPPPVDEARLTSGYLRQLQLQWRNDELAQRAALLGRLGDPVVDVYGRFRDRPDLPRLLMADGLHLTIDGQVEVVRLLVEHLSERGAQQTASQPGPGTVAGIGHVGLYVGDLAAAVAFWTGAVGLEITDGSLESGVVFLSSNPVLEHHMLLLRPGRFPADAVVVQQLSWRCADLGTVLAIRHRLHQAGVDTMDVSHGNAIGVYFHDPDGNLAEVYWHTGLEARQVFKLPVDLDAPVGEVLRQVRADVATHGATGVRADVPFTGGRR